MKTEKAKIKDLGEEKALMVTQLKVNVKIAVKSVISGTMQIKAVERRKK
jgi:hypothetical protein